jgi:hypothetical protein
MGGRDQPSVSSSPTSYASASARPHSSFASRPPAGRRLRPRPAFAPAPRGAGAARHAPVLSTPDPGERTGDLRVRPRPTLGKLGCVGDLLRKRMLETRTRRPGRAPSRRSARPPRAPPGRRRAPPPHPRPAEVPILRTPGRSPTRSGALPSRRPPAGRCGPRAPPAPWRELGCRQFRAPAGRGHANPLSAPPSASARTTSSMKTGGHPYARGSARRGRRATGPRGAGRATARRRPRRPEALARPGDRWLFPSSAPGSQGGRWSGPMLACRGRRRWCFRARPR